MSKQQEIVMVNGKCVTLIKSKSKSVNKINKVLLKYFVFAD